MAKQNLKVIEDWKKEFVERIVIQPRKEERIGERLDKAVYDGLARSRQAYIIDAVDEKLRQDGYK